MRSVIPFPRVAYDYIVKRPFLAWGCLALPSALFTVIKVAGRSLHLVDNQGDMYWATRLLFWSVLILSLVYAYLKSVADKWDNLGKFNGQFVLREMLDSANAVTDKKTRRFETYIKAHKGEMSLEPFPEITQPEAQVECILENLQTTLRNMCAIPRDLIGISVLLSTDWDTKWRWLCAVNVGQDVTIDSLLSNPNSTISVILSQGRNSIFHADKRKARDIREYAPVPKDQGSECIGSIICRKITLGNSHPYLSAVLSISTYGLQLCRDDDVEAKNKIESIILHSFECRLRLELCLYYIKQYAHLSKKVTNTTVIS